MILSRFAVLTSVLFLAISSVPGQNPQMKSVLPVVKSAEIPLYPHIARLARIQGTAQMKVWTDGASIAKVEGSGAHKLLIDAAKQNLRTWHFYPHKPISFTVTFVYSLEGTEVAGSVNPSLFLELPTRVEIRTKPHPIETEVAH
ncbi:MAG TPA: hypothetical protein VF532_16210 [Candidatus Angelobacter sp.]